MSTKLPSIILVASVLILCGCAGTRMNSHTDSGDTKKYTGFVVNDLSITTASNDMKMQVSNKELKEEYRQEFSNILRSAKRDVVDSSSVATQNSNSVAVVSTDVAADFGSRAMRYFVGFGAGKAVAVSTLTVKDEKTNREIYRDSRTIHLTMGGFGGDFSSYLKQRLVEQIREFAETLQ